MGTASNESSIQDWQLQVELDVANTQRSLHDLLDHLRGPAIVNDIKASVRRDVVITHDGKLLFAYAADEATPEAARNMIESALRRDGSKQMFA
jgi:hypothetical protein